ncbi:three-Cys-motif partner protein TcmP [Pleomorphomonas sp. PLEO]|uniref:three-Cys-motif partner protein TcmP n=1 Tax=Pleomorphomonas sp. PLEO TaxID=3239306 RepID=UPI00351DD317
MIGELELYKGREQAYVKHFLLGEYLEAWAYKIGSQWNEVAYIDGFSGPWQNAGEQFQDTSFGIALATLAKVKARWNELGRSLKMSAYLVEKDPTAYAKLQGVSALFPDVQIKTYQGSFIELAQTILRDIPRRAFSFLLIDPKGWRIEMDRIAPLVKRPNSEVVFNFMFDFINRFVNVSSPGVAASLDALFLEPGWRQCLREPTPQGRAESEHRKIVLIEAFSGTLARIGNYPFVAETTVLRPTVDRPLYSLIYGTRSPAGLEVFRECQIKALRKQDKARGVAKLQASVAASEQAELFESFAQMAPDPAEAYLAQELINAKASLLDLVPAGPSIAIWGDIWPRVLGRHIVSRSQLNAVASDLRKSGHLNFLDWAPRKRSPDDHYRVQRAEQT